MGNLHQPQAGKQQHGVVQMRHGFPNACQRFLRMTPEQEKTNVEQQDGDGNEKSDGCILQTDIAWQFLILRVEKQSCYFTANIYF